MSMREKRKAKITERLIDLLESAEYEPQSYSGRAMYGARCVSVVSDDNREAMVVLNVLHAAIENDMSRAELLETIETLKRGRSDDMGRGSVYYWPDAAWPNKEDA